MTDNSKNNNTKDKIGARMEHQRRRPSLDEAMEEIFHPQFDRQQFSLAALGGRNSERYLDFNTKFSENDYQSHRTESHHHYHPLHRVHLRHLRPAQREEAIADADRAKSEDPIPGTSATTPPVDLRGQEVADSLQTCSETCIEDMAPSAAPVFTETSWKGKLPLKSALKRGGSADKELSPVVSSPALPLVHLTRTPEFARPTKIRPAKDAIAEDTEEEEKLLPDPSTLPEKLKVKFILGASELDVCSRPVAEKSETTDAGAVQSPTKQKITSPPKRLTRRYSQPDYKCADLTLRKHQGSDLGSKSYAEILEPDEAKDLPSADIDDVASHRFDDPKGIRRHKIRGPRSVQGVDGHIPPAKKEFDHQPHEVFVQLDELLMDQDIQELVWRETARWIKYEEDVQVRADRWGKPHVAPLSFHSLLNLRLCLESGVVLLDLEEEDFEGIVDKIVISMIEAELLTIDQKLMVLKKLLLRHRHGNVKVPHPVLRRTSVAFMNFNQMNNDKSSPGLLKPPKNKSDVVLKIPSPETDVLIPKQDSHKPEVITTKAAMKPSPSFDDVLQHPTSILRRIPVNSEGTIVLVGALEALKQPAVAFVRLSAGTIIPYLLEVPIPVRFIFILLGPPNYTDMDYHEIGRSIATLMSNREFHDAVYKANERNELLSAINIFLDESVVLPPGDFEKRSLLPLDEIRRKSIQYRKKIPRDSVDEALKVKVRNPLKRTGKCFGGFIADIKQRYPLYLSDIKDGINSQCLASIVFIYFASLAGAIAFGGLLEDKTKGMIGVSETLVATCIVGIVFALLSCQPLVIVGTTGPFMIVDEILFQFCERYHMQFLTLRIWTSIFTAIITTIVVGFEGSSLVRFFSRFMQEIYAFVIALIYIVESMTKLYEIFRDNPMMLNYPETVYSNSTVIATQMPHPNTALFSAILMITTFGIAYSLRKLRNSKFLFRQARRALGDFGVPIAMALMVLLDFCVRNVYTQKLNVPEGLAPTSPDVRGWLISPFPVTAIEICTAAIAACLFFILFFLETQICELIVNKKERNLKKGTGFHADMIIVSYCTIVCAFLGGPWVGPAAVRAISHVASITVWSKTHAPGEVAHIVEVKEQRVTAFFVSLLVGTSVLMTPVLRQVPIAVLFGVFLYMGVSSLSGIQFWERIKLMFMPPKHHPDHYRFVSEVRAGKMNVYTCAQLACVVAMWVIKSSILAPGFPFAIIALILVHSLLKKFFKPKEFEALDGEEKATKEEEPDFYEQIVA